MTEVEHGELLRWLEEKFNNQGADIAEIKADIKTVVSCVTDHATRLVKIETVLKIAGAVAGGGAGTAALGKVLGVF